VTSSFPPFRSSRLRWIYIRARLSLTAHISLRVKFFFVWSCGEERERRARIARMAERESEREKERE